MFFPAGTIMVNAPLVPVEAPTEVPFTRTEAPTAGVPFSLTTPVTVFCALINNAQSKKKLVNKKVFKALINLTGMFLIISSFLINE